MRPAPEPGAGQLNRWLVLVGLVTFATGLVGLDARATYGARVSADEPQYLLTAISLAEDADLDISDELAAQRYRAFHEVTLDPQTLELNASGQQLSPHDPLLPLLLAGPVRVAGWAGAKVALALLAAATAVATLFVAVRRFGSGAGVGALVVTGFFAAPPLGVYATQVYPEMPAALATMVGLAAVTAPRPRSAGAGAGERVVGERVVGERVLGERAAGMEVALAVVAIVALPWLAVKYLPVAAVLAAALAWRHRDRGGRSFLVPGAVLALAGVAYLWIHQRIYGGWTVYAAGDHFVGGEWQVVGRSPDYVGRSRRLIGLLIDRGFGLAAWNPAFLALPAALAAVVGRGWPGVSGSNGGGSTVDHAAGRSNGAPPALILVGLLAAGWATATWVALTMHGWWWPGRQLVVVTPLVVVAVAAALSGHWRPARRPAWLLALVAGGCGLGVATWWWLAVEASTGRRTLIVDFEETAAPWYRLWRLALPDHRRMETIDVALTVGWAAVLGLSAVLAWRRARSGDQVRAGSRPTGGIGSGPAAGRRAVTSAAQPATASGPGPAAR